MARYIDADKFKSHLEKAMEKMHLIGGVKGVDVGAVITALDRQPTADVAPRSEVENYKQIAEYQQKLAMDRYFEIKRLQEEIESLKDTNEHLAVMLEEEKQGADELAEEHSDLIVEKDQLFDIAEKQKLEIESLKIANEKMYSAIEATKAEVAREIFEELYKSVYLMLPMQCTPIFKMDLDLGFEAGVIDGRRNALFEVLVLIAELKKKYTGEKDNES